MKIDRKIKNLVDNYREWGVKDTFRRYLGHLVRLMWTYKPIWTPRRLYCPLDSIHIDWPVFFVGTQGAGLTLLTRMVRRHHQVVMIGGGPGFWTGVDETDKHTINYTHFPDALSLRSPGYKNMTGLEKDHAVFGLARSWVYATDILFGSYRKTARDADVDVCQALEQKIKRSIRAYAEDVQHARFIDKSQSYALKIPLLRSCLPDARFVIQLRDSYVMCWREATRDPAVKYRHWNVKPSLEEGLRLTAQHWRNIYQTALVDIAGQTFGLVTRFEDLISMPEKTLKQVLAFIELEFNPDLLPSAHQTLPLGSNAEEKWYPLRKDVNERHLSSITDSACEIIQEEVGDIADPFGYTPPTKRLKWRI